MSALFTELEARRCDYEASVVGTTQNFVSMMGAAQAIGVGSPLGDMQTNRFAVPLTTQCIGIANLQADIAAAALTAPAEAEARAQAARDEAAAIEAARARAA